MLPWLKDDTGEFANLRYRGAVLYKGERKLIFTFSTPEPLNKDSLNKLNAMLLSNTIEGFRFEIEMVRDVQTHDTIKSETAKFLRERFYAVYMKYNDSGYYVNKTVVDCGGKAIDGYKVTFKTDTETENLFTQMGLLDALTEYFHNYTVTPVSFSTQIEESNKDLEAAVSEIDTKQELVRLDIMTKPKRTIAVKGSKAIIGKVVNGSAMYISDLKEPTNKIVICGKVSDKSIIKPKNPESKVKFVCKMKVQDFTGTITVVWFCKEDEPILFESIEEGSEIILFGNASISGTGKYAELQVIANSISACSILPPTHSETVREPNAKYLCVNPMTFEYRQQNSFFDKEIKVPECIKDKDIVVFDLETTGLRPISDKIIEIGAVKVHNGKITEYFETLVNPEMHIPEDATKVNNITDEMVKDAPKASHILGDFYKFCYNTIIVSHNIEFDYGFLQFMAVSAGYNFDNEKRDTLTMAKEFFKKKRSVRSPKDYKLRSLAAVFEIEQLEAHRAFDDARVAAEVLIAMLNEDEALIQKS